VADTPVLDTDVLVDHLRDAGPGKELVDRLAGASGFRITAVSAFELVLGRSYLRNPEPVDTVLAVPCLVLTRDAAVRAGGLLRELRARGAAIDIRDAMQAGICIEAGARLVTRNHAHFDRVRGLAVSDPSVLP
jgi:predicted nucleic acid-binding protein